MAGTVWAQQEPCGHCVTDGGYGPQEPLQQIGDYWVGIGSMWLIDCEQEAPTRQVTRWPRSALPRSSGLPPRAVVL
ncbi:MAG: hypothetical protein AMXMBFR61_23010 [Fimbriimonadales bacterium]